MKVWVTKYALTKKGVYTIDAEEVYEGATKYFVNVNDRWESYTASEVCTSYVYAVYDVQSRKIQKILSLARSIARVENLSVAIPND